MSQRVTAQWEALNVRQQTYLRALYDCDQATEAERRISASKGFYDRTPASVWRWQMYGPVAPSSMLYTTLKQAKLIDAGTGSTWQTLEARKLVQCRTVRDALGIDLLEVQITALGRKLVRAATGEPPKSKAPTGQLRERQWSALVRLYVAGDTGVLHDDMLYARGGFDWMRTLIRLRDYTPAPLMEEYRQWIWVKRLDGEQSQQEYCVRVTSYGRDYYEREWGRYRKLYPNVEAPEPNAAPAAE